MHIPQNPAVALATAVRRAQCSGLRDKLWLSASIVIAALLTEPGLIRAQDPHQFDSMPVITTSLLLACNPDHPTAPSAIANRIRVVATNARQEVTGDFFVHVPGGATPPQSDQWNVTKEMGIRLPGIRSVGDISRIELEVPELACVDLIEFRINSRIGLQILNPAPTGFRSSPAPNGNAAPENVKVLAITSSDIQTAAATHDREKTCALPLEVHPNAVQATVAGVIGDVLIRNDDTWFAADDYVAIVREGEEVTVEFTAHSSRGSAKILLDLAVACGPSQPTATDPNPTGQSISIKTSNVTVNEIDGDDAITIIAAELGIAQGILENELEARLSNLSGGLGEVVRNLPLCPSITFKASRAGLPSVKILGVGIRPPSLVIDTIDLTLLGSEPITLCI